MAQNKNLQKLELTWISKGDEPKLEPRILIENPEYSYGDPNTENMLIHGDNLLALKALEQDYAGKVKCIYIDPPYNTGNAFEHYDDGLEHSLWLSLMSQRLKLLRETLKDIYSQRDMLKAMSVDAYFFIKRDEYCFDVKLNLFNELVESIYQFDKFYADSDGVVDDFVISFFTTGNGVSNLSIYVYTTAKRLNPKINALSTVMFLVIMLLLFVINKRTSKDKDSNVLIS